MSRLFISHASADNPSAFALAQWLTANNYGDYFLDTDSQRGLVPGERWMEQLRAAADKCEAVLCLISPNWLASEWCWDEFRLARILHKRIFALIVAEVPRDSLPPEMKAEWQLCDLVGPDPIEHFDIDGTRVSFHQEGLERLRRGLERAGLDPLGFPWTNERPPYPGLRALEPDDAAIFFGRDSALIRAMDQIRGMGEAGTDRLLVILGASGAGKSSFLRAGLWPRLVRDDTHFLPLPVIRPENAAISGTAGLAAALAGAYERLGVRRAVGDVKASLSGGEPAFLMMLDDLAARARSRLTHIAPEDPPPTLVLAVDQAEELLIPSGGTEAATFRALLSAALAPGRRVLAIATVRTDRYDRMQDQALFPGVGRALFDLFPMERTEFRAVIEGPARRVAEAGRRLVLDPALTDALIADAEGADALPLLAFTLERLWREFGARGELTRADYDTLGAVRGAIEAAVREALAEPGRTPAVPADPEAQRRALHATFIPWLAAVDPVSGETGRRVAGLAEMPESSHGLVERFAAARLLVLGEDGAVEIAHEALLRQWPDLVGWLEADSAALRLAAEIERAADAWAANGRRDGWLDHRAERLEAAESLLRREDFRRRLGVEREAYVAACRGLAERETKDREAALARTARLQRRVGRALAAFATLLVVGLGIVGWQQDALNNRKSDLGVEQAANAELQERLKVREQSLRRSAINLRIELAQLEIERKHLTTGVRVALLVVRDNVDGYQQSSAAIAQLASALWAADWLVALGGHEGKLTNAAYSSDGTRILTAADDGTARVWDATSGRPISILSGHNDLVGAVAFSRDGAHIVTASNDQTARVWDTSSGRTIAIFRGHGGPVFAAAFSTNGDRVVTVSADCTIRVWGAVSGQAIATFYEDERRCPHPAVRTAIGGKGMWGTAAFSPDAARVITSFWDQTASVWDIASGRLITVLRGHESRITSVAFSPNGARVVTGSHDNTARVWDANSGRSIATLRGHETDITSVAFSSNGARIVTGSWDNTAAQVWDAASGRPIGILRGQRGGSVAAFSPDGALVVTDGQDDTACVWDAATGRLSNTLRGHDDALMSVAFSPDGSHVVTASRDNTARVWDTTAKRPLATFRGHESGVDSAAFSPDGSHVVITSLDGTARVWDAASGRLAATLRDNASRMDSAAFSPDGEHIVTVSDEGIAHVWNAKSGRHIATLRRLEDRVLTASFSPDGRRIVTGSLDGIAQIWDATTGRPVATLRGPEFAVHTAAFSPDSARIVTAFSDGTAHVWDAATGRPAATLRGHELDVNTAAFSPDGTRIVTASDDRTARVWDAFSGQVVARLDGHEGRLISAAFSPDGARIVTSADDNTARIWDAETGKLTAILYERRVASAKFSSSGTRVITSSSDGTARVWDTASGRSIAVLGEQETTVNVADFSPDGTRVVTTASDGTARVWDARVLTMTPQQLVTEACTRRLRGISTLTRAEMDLLGYPADTPPINVCDGIPLD